MADPSPPGLRYAFTIVARIGAIGMGGPGPLGQRQHIPIEGGEVSGPALQGRIRSGGSDWALVRADGASLIDAHYTIEASDGALIYVRSRGLRVSSPEVLARMRAGQPVDPAEVYFRGTPSFEAPEGPHSWLNNHLFVATLARAGDGVRLQVFQVE
ncbi:DUF3237 domain-containing protein [Hydrogenophaga sp. SL48]|uniref:DUF3237 domain-containing protein n=1 Tax=Hydrogenophaga sp. SL48 TaxID=2806347 RepID=UPI001F3EFB85|nr:DUF3237 domain-containing protein [Hydrogenophaga sp. SL48]UJW82035.1 DUF3237 domain-containing protein [Hydrogenophaga sp. SL48]